MFSLTYGLVLFLSASASASANKSSSECWACKSHVLSCTGSDVIVIHSASYGYKAGCSSGITGGGCTVNERNRCCKPGSSGTDCYKPFNKTDREELERTCSSKSTCTFNSTRHDQPYNCSSFTYSTNFFTLINYTCQTPEIKTTSRCLGCTKNRPHVLFCTGSSVIVIRGASYGYKEGCISAMFSGACNATERNRCCKPGGSGRDCYKSFNITDRQKLEGKCSSKSACNFYSIRHDQLLTCGDFTFSTNSFTLINYTCQAPAHLLSTISLTTTSQYTTATFSPEESSITNSAGATNQVTISSNVGQKMPLSDGNITSGEIGGIVIGVIAIVILLCIAAFLLYQRYENTNRQPEPNRRQSTTRTVGVQYRETDFTDITTSPNITTSSSDTTYSQLNRLGSQPVQYDGLVMNNNNSTTDNNYTSYYNQQYVNM